MSTDKPRILMFAPFCYPPAGSEAIVTSKLLLAMIDAGWHIDVISQADFGHYYPVSSHGTWDDIKKIIHNIEGIKKNSIFGKLSTLSGLPSFRTICWVAKALRTANRLSAKIKYDFILSRAAPQYGHLPALIFSQWSKIPWIANWSDPMPPQKAPLPYGQGPSALLPVYLQEYCNAVVKNASWHTFPSERLRRYFSSYMSECGDKSSIIPHVALERFRSQPMNSPNEFSLCHPGSLTMRGPYIFLEGARLFLRNTKMDVPFKIKFIGLHSSDLQNASQKLNLESLISIEGVKRYEETQEICANSSVLVIIEADCEEGIFFPSKFVDFLQTGRPILAISPVVGTLKDIISQYGGGIAVDRSSPGAIANAIQKFYIEWKKRTLEEKYSSSRLFNLFSEKQVIEKYIEIFSLIKSRQNNIR